jgi:protein associated with RNAse G/E
VSLFVILKKILYNEMRKRDYMSDIKVGDKLKIYCYKHDGTLEHTSEEAVVLENNDDFLVCGNGRTKITEKDGRSHMTNEPAVLFFYKKHWFNIIGQLKKFGLFYYCNIASPYIIDGKSIKYIDYDLDLRVFPDGGFRVLDRNEYNYHKKIMHYSDDLDFIIKSELSQLIELKRSEKGPFEKGIVDKYYEIYEKIKKN